MPSQIIAEISRPDLTDLPASSSATITGVQHLASYNWLEKSVPTISVPGTPALWSPPSVSSKLTPDSGMVYIDQNAARNPSSPLEPLFRSLYSQKPDFQIGDIDLVTDRNNIRKLLRFVKGSSTDKFEIQVEIVGSKTALFTRVEEKTTDFIQGFRGFGHNFEKAYTKGPAGSTGHHRIVSYDFGGMKMIIRHETDGYIGSKTGSVAVTRPAETTDSLSDLLGSLSISKPAATAIKTRAASRTLDMAEVTPQLWISQTPILVVGYHQRGVFDDVQLRNMKQGIRNWERDNEKALRSLASLMKKIIAAAKSSSNRNAVVKYYGGTKLRIFTGKQNRALPNDLYSKWEVKK
ncbi:hypothetical protein AOQ84DRAFT_287231 [Glonium stellatum]|uniref:Geranylgeranyl pyrophosphate synthetase n=1 Tax=Glonium stellatum TaxID=574774 RepID=A0A8E2F7M2_9PEZI|nr:hypothetical protein AOQ84DRAFT_287231 [Glonium stellatum]